MQCYYWFRVLFDVKDADYMLMVMNAIVLLLVNDYCHVNIKLDSFQLPLMVMPNVNALGQVNVNNNC